ncbi:glutamate-rich protein 1-like isoform X1 [Dipodomys merriami]|uniref:glutamate-rich protein 1-like isoform X1 n=1 Tax=Dipodomys merriami TaxID=94247 RepID=UPI003855B8D6
MSTRKDVFVEKVLKKLFPNVPSGQEKDTLQILTSETPPKKVTSRKAKHKHVHHLTDGDIKIYPKQRLYTVSLPPEGYVPSEPEPNCTSSENIASADDTEADLDPLDQPKRRRIRKHKPKKKLKNPNEVPLEQAELEDQSEFKKQQSLLQEKIQPQHTDGPTMSRNKKRKLKKKQQMRRKKEAGLVKKASGVSFLYQPEESSSDQEELRGAVGEGSQDPLEEGEEDLSEEGTATDLSQEYADITSKADSVLNFLKSTQEIYFYDGISKDSDSAVCMETIKELLHCLESHSMPPSDIFILDHMKTLLLLQDTERLKRALEMFPEHCMMPSEHTKVISAFFNYWITQVFPEKKSE